ncbi:drug:proton antiporter [Afipia sp. P52-10]|jgi:catechol 2,3-dioxygenase-like lactoylglutathione lyase family enzyme|uniref:VOC family protein n=1 Tax=Afipia sp. P52-10 TaxID=1429916 RepID=UPI0003DF403C|nr:VOC family protein [Afipia sp. P52-10]ETR77316.1 drug:proton antiporter [Afipia sp. P52-10]
MPHPTYMLLYVDDPQASGEFYRALLDCAPVETSPTFVLFVLASGLKLGLWSRHTAQPAAAAAGGGGEIGIAVESSQAVDATHADWRARGVPMLQAPVDMDFGRTFVALDPDGHRLRVLALTV